MVGNAPWDSIRRRTIRAEVNPLDKTTIVSIYPMDIHEVKVTLQPGVFDIPKGSFEEPSHLVVGPSSWWRELGDNEPLLEIPVSSIVMANSIVRDFIVGILECDMGEKMPGLFFVQGAKSIDQIKKDHKKELNEAKIKQDNWYHALVELADNLWARTNGNPLAISNDMRIAARALNLESKDWLANSQAAEVKRCAACGTLNNTAVIVCPNCKIILDPKRFADLGLSFAK